MVHKREAPSLESKVWMPKGEVWQCVKKRENTNGKRESVITVNTARTGYD